jgi:hypothetical protein
MENSGLEVIVIDVLKLELNDPLKDVDYQWSKRVFIGKT